MGKKSKTYPKKYWTTRYGEVIPVFKDERCVHAFAVMIINLSKKGHTLEMILANMDIPNSLWVKNVEKRSILRQAVEDATVFHRAFGQQQLKKMAQGKIAHSPVMAKVWLSSFYNISEVYQEPEGKKERSGYVVITEQSKPEEEPSEPNKG